MKLLGEIRDSDIFPDAQNQVASHFSEKHTSRAVLLNGLGQIGLLYVSERGYHKLPGGEIEGDETPEQAARREVIEETGCEVEILGEVGKVIEYKNRQQRKQTSFCYLARQVGEKVAPTFTDNEIRNNYIEVWLNDIDSAISVVTADQPEDYSRIFIRARELVFLNAAKLLLASS